MDYGYYFIIFVLFILFLITAVVYELYSNETLKSSVKCIGRKYNRTCLYRNIYFINGTWIVINLPKNEIKCVSIRSRSSNLCFKPIPKKGELKYHNTIYGLSTYIYLFYSGNVGHLLFDDLYPMYLSFLKFNFKMEKFNIILSKSDSNWRNNWLCEIFENFSMNKLLYESDMNNGIYLVKNLIVGLAHQCQRCVNKDYSIPGGKEYKATWWMRRRMYYVYNITKCHNRYAIIVYNKRYTDDENNMLHRLIYYFKNSLTILYIDWSKYMDFSEQIEILSCTSIYISGPGTALLNSPFISDPGIIINLGGLFRGCPSFMEQYIEEGSMHFISLYYPSKIRKYGLKENETKILIEKAINILNNWQNFKIQQKSNLNIEGQIFKRISNKNPELMNKFLFRTDWAKDVGFGVWAEKLLYFPFCYNQNYIVDKVLDEAAMYKQELGCEISNSSESCWIKET